MIGDKAKGEVTVYRVGSQLNLSSGTLLYGPGDLKFSLDNSVTIASGSASTPGVTKVQVSAEAIGAEYNLASGATFSVGNYSTVDIEAKNENSFSGGSSRDISAVSEDDQEKLQKELEAELKGEIEKEFEEKVGGEEHFIKESLLHEAPDTEFSHKVGDEASTLKLTMTLDGTAMKIKREELVNLSREALKDKVPAGFVLRGEQIVFSFEDVKEEDGKYNFSDKVSGNLLPEVKTDELAKKIAGKYPSLAEEYLQKEAPGFVRTEIRFKPMLPGKLKTLPHLVKNIEVELSAER